MRHFLSITFLAFCISLSSCTSSEKTAILNQPDYNSYLTTTDNKKYAIAMEEFTFWENKFNKTPHQYPYLIKMAGAQSSLFQASGKIQHLTWAGNFLEVANKKTNRNNPAILRGLAQNYISQHRFNEALELIEKAEEIGAELSSTHKMLFDVHLELGNDKKAFDYLSRLENKTEFDYLIRLSKWEDHRGNLDMAIRIMEGAVKKAEQAKDKDLMQWAYTNLADFYGHDGQIEASYRHYLKALALDPYDAYAMKGIAWIGFSHERDPAEALRILEAINTRYSAPDYMLLKAEISAYAGDENQKVQHISAYLKEVENEDYGNMYNKYSATLLTEELGEADLAMKIAEQEIELRPTPQSYALLAWALYHKGESAKALEVVEQKVKGKSFEPALMYQMAVIYKANHLAIAPLKEELLESVYELGPVAEQKIRTL